MRKQNEIGQNSHKTWLCPIVIARTIWFVQGHTDNKISTSIILSKLRKSIFLVEIAISCNKQNVKIG